MTIRTVAVLSPGEMGSAVGRALRSHSLDVITCLAGRSAASQARAAQAGFRDVSTLEDLVREAGLVLSVLVPAEAPGVARAVADAMRATGATPAFADCNAISPATVKSMAQVIEAAGGAFIDGGIIGGPPREGYATRFYVSGPDAHLMGELDGKGIEVRQMGPEVGRASAMKMCYAAATKGVTALQTAQFIAAARLGVLNDLIAEMEGSQGAALKRMEGAVQRLPSVAHRWIGEMEEIASTFEAAGVTGRFHEGSADIFRLVSEAFDLPAAGDGARPTSMREIIDALAAREATRA